MLFAKKFFFKIATFSCVDLSFCWLIFNTGTFSLSQNMLLIVKDKFSSSLISFIRSEDNQTTMPLCQKTVKTAF